MQMFGFQTQSAASRLGTSNFDVAAVEQRSRQRKLKGFSVDLRIAVPSLAKDMDKFFESV